MAITYTPTTNFGAKDSLPTNDPDKVIKGSEFTTEFTAIQTAFSLAATAASPTFTGTATLPSVDINGGTIDGTSIGASSKSSGAFTSLEVSATSPSLLFTETDVTDKNTKFLNSAGNFFIQEISNDGLTSVNRIKLDHTTGNMTFYDDTSAGTVLFLDAVNNRAGINTINPASTLDVNGTVTADGLTVAGVVSVDGDVGIDTNYVFGQGLGYAGNTTSAGAGTLVLYDASTGAAVIDGFGPAYLADSGVILKQSGVKGFHLKNNNDIEFYEDTGTTPKFFWDASEEVLAIGASSATRVSTSYGQITLNGASGGLLNFTDDGVEGVRLQSVVSDFYIQANGNTIFRNGGFTGGNEAMRIDSSGNVGIGTQSPARQLQVGDGGTAVSNVHSLMRIEGATRSGGLNGATLEFVHITNAPATLVSSIGTITEGGRSETAMQFNLNSTERMRIDSSGNLLVGGTATNPAASNTDGFAVSSAGRLNVQTSGSYHRMGRGEDGFIVAFYSEGSVEGSIAIAGSTTSYNTSSDYRLKNVDGPITNSGAYIDALKPVQGSWKVDGSRFIGLIAHEVQEVSETPIATGEKDGEEMQGMDYSAPELIANLIAEIQSLRARVAQLEGA